MRTRALIDGHWTDAGDGSTRTVTNPATGKTLARIANNGAAGARRAIEAAKRTAILRRWQERPSERRWRWQIDRYRSTDHRTGR